MTKKAIIYCKVASVELGNSKKNESIVNQERICLDYCKENNLELYQEECFYDAGCKDKNRSVLKMIIELAKQDAFDVLVVDRMSRLPKSLTSLTEIMNQLRDFGVEIHTVEEKINTATSEGQLNLYMYSFVRECYSQALSNSIMAGIQAKRAREASAVK